MKALVGAFNQEKALVGAFSVIVQPVVEPMELYTALVRTRSETKLKCDRQSEKVNWKFIFRTRVRWRWWG